MQEMHEDDIGAVFAAAVPEAVPLVGDLHHRARALGRRRRTYRNMLSVGGAGVAVVAVAGAALALGNGDGADGAAKVSAGAQNAAAATTPPSAATGSPAKAADAARSKFGAGEVADVVGTLLPQGWVVKQTQGTSAPGTFRADLVLAEPSGALVTLSAVLSPSATVTDTCPADVKCTTGTARLQGHEAGWKYFQQFGSTTTPPTKPSGPATEIVTRAGADSEGLSIADPAGGYRIELLSTGRAEPNMLSMEELKHIGLNEKFVSALLAGSK